jgi:AraC-like DNA-binding protein
MKAQFEQVTVPAGESWRLLWRELPELPFLWHYHPEFELTLTLNAQGQRYVGDSLEDFASGDLVLTGPNQPHTWAATERPDTHRPMLAVVMWFRIDWLERALADWPELGLLQNLSTRAGRGLKFSDAARAQVQLLILALQAQEPALRLPTLLQILVLLAKDAGARPLATHAYTPAGDKVGERMGKILRRLHEQAAETVSALALANEVAMSVGAFHRFFKRHTGMTVLDYMAQLRIGQACQLLINTSLPINVIASDVGYGTLAHFNRQFLLRKGMTPRAFRASYQAGHRPPGLTTAL